MANTRRSGRKPELLKLAPELLTEVRELAQREGVSIQHTYRKLIARGLTAVKSDPTPHPLGIAGVDAPRAPRRPLTRRKPPSINDTRARLRELHAQRHSSNSNTGK
jgi:hypothetical protein